MRLTHIRLLPRLLAGLLVPASLAACTAADPEPAPTPTTASSSGPPSPSPSASASASASAPAYSACVQEQLDGLTLGGRAGQALMVGVPAPTARYDRSALAQRVGGVFLAGRSTARVSTVRVRTDALRARAARGGAPGLLVAADQEGGRVQTFSGPGFAVMPDALAQGAWSTAKLRARTRAWTEDLAAAGISMNLAPVADVVPAARAASNPPIGRFDRQFGGTPAPVAQDVGTVVAAMEAGGVVATVKHFPGLGRVRANTDTSTRAVDRVAGPDDPALEPFRAGIEAGAGAVMISSARYPRLDPDRTAAFSPAVVTGLLRQRLGYDGLVISDDLGRAAAVQQVPVGRRAVRFVRAGGDLVLTVRTADAATMRAALVAEARTSPAFRRQLDTAVGRVLTLKERAGLLDC